MKLQVMHVNRSSSQEMKNNIGSSGVPFVMNGGDSSCGVDLIKPSMIIGGGGTNTTTTNGGVKYLFQSYQQQLEPPTMMCTQVIKNDANLVQSPSSQLPQTAAAAAFFMSNEEARRLKGLSLSLFFFFINLYKILKKFPLLFLKFNFLLKLEAKSL